MLRLLSGAWNLIKGSGKLGIGAAVGAGGLALANGGGLTGIGKSIVGEAAEVGAHGGVEQSKNTLSETMNWLADILEALFGENNAASRMCRRFGERSLGREEAERRENDRLSELPLNDPERASQRIYETAATSGPDARYRIDGPGGSPPSVLISDEPPSTANTVLLGVKGVKDGIGVAAGWAGGLVAGAADFVGLDYLTTGRGGFGFNGWATATSDAIAGTVNDATDIVFLGHEPTIRSEFDRSVYGVTSTVSGAVVGTFAGGWLTGAFGLAGTGGVGVATGLRAPFTTASLGLDALRTVGTKHALTVASMIPMPGRRPTGP